MTKKPKVAISTMRAGLGDVPPRLVAVARTLGDSPLRAWWRVTVPLALPSVGIGALLVAIDANEDNGLVSFVLSAADAVDLGVFSRENGIREFDGSNAETKNALFNWGLGAVAYLVVGRLLERVIKP